ncbi:uncharacterized protein LOC134228509 isoform X2 [Saccostrea cucullata]|uniref:uncharacterized protein LOC134228509 isoform X2 n=1 Tax=Saccostrea cuccullata TaxID=36930 RepID=UPI002ED66D9E
MIGRIDKADPPTLSKNIYLNIHIPNFHEFQLSISYSLNTYAQLEYTNMWTFNINGHLLLDNKDSGEIKMISSSNKFGMIKVTLKEGRSLFLTLKNFDSTEHANFDKMCRTSRTAFLQWAKRENMCVQDLAAVASSTEATGSSNAASVSIESSSSQQNNTADDNNDADDQINTNESKQIAFKDLDTKLLGRNLLVPICNLIEPAPLRKVRDLDQSHVRELEKQLIDTPQVFSVLIGHVTAEDASLDVVQVEGFPHIEVLGGNHTRQALQNLMKREGSIQKVCIDIYKNLTPTEAMLLGLNHNAKHEYSKQTSFVEIVKLFRKLREECQSKEKSAKKCALMWRGQAAVIMGVNTKLKNSYRTHLHCASVDDELWILLDAFFQSWKLNKIRKKPKGEIKQTHLMAWTQCVEKEKGGLLRQITNGELDFAKFKEMCIKSKKSLAVVESDVQEIQDNQQTGEDENVITSKKQAGKDGEETEVSDNENSTRSVSLREDERDIDIAKPSETMTEKKLKEEQRRNEDLCKELRTEQEKNEELKTEINLLKSELTETKKWSQSWEEKYHTIKHQHAEIHQKLIQQQDALKHAEAAAARARMKSRIEEETKKNDHEDTLPTTQSEVTEKRNDNTAPVLHDSTSKGKKRKQKETEEEEMTEVDCGLVLYGGKIYFGTFETSEKFVFCKLPIATINAENAVIIDERAKTREINMRDCQTVNKEDIVMQQKGQIDSKGNVLIDVTVTAVKEAVKKFIRK